MSDVLDYVREKDPRFKEVDDTELTLYIGDRQPDFLKDEGFKQEFQQAKLSKVPAPPALQPPPQRSSLEPVMAGEAPFPQPALQGPKEQEPQEVEFLKRIDSNDKGWSPELRAALKTIQFEPPPGIKKPDLTGSDIATIYEQFQIEAAQRLEEDAKPLRTPLVRVSPQWTEDELEALKRAPRSIQRIAGYMDTVGGFVDFLTTYEGAVTMPALAAAGIPGILTRLGFGATMVKGSFDAAEELGKELAKPEAERDLKKIGQLESAMVLNTAMGGALIGREIGRGAGGGGAAAATRIPALQAMAERMNAPVVPALKSWVESVRLQREPGRAMPIEAEAALGGSPIRQFAPQTAAALTEVGEARLIHPPKPAIEPKPPLPNVPRGTFAPEVPATLPEAERGINVIEEIQGAGARTIADIQRLFPQAKLNREAARRLRDQAWPEQAAEGRMQEQSLQQSLINERSALERIENKTQADLDRMAQLDVQIEQAKKGQYAVYPEATQPVRNVRQEPGPVPGEMPPEVGGAPPYERGRETPEGPAPAPVAPGPKAPEPPAGAAAPIPTAPPKPETTKNWQVTVQAAQKMPGATELKAAWDKFDETGESTARDLADEIESLIDEGKAPTSLRRTLDDYREALEEDIALKGRGDVDPAEEAFTKAVERAVAGTGVPGYVQIDEITGGQNVWSKSRETLAKEGVEVPDFSQLPSGKYSYSEAESLLRAQKIQLTREEVLPTGPEAVKAIVERFGITDLQARNLLHRERERHGVSVGGAAAEIPAPAKPAQPELLPPAVPPAEPEAQIKRRRRLASEEGRQWDVIDELSGQFGKGKISLSEVRKNRPNFVPIGAARKFFAKEGFGPDVAMQTIEKTHPYESVDDFLDALNAAGKGRIAHRARFYREQRMLVAEGKQAEAFGKLTGAPGANTEPLQPSELYPGDEFKVAGEPVKIKEFRFDENGDVDSVILDGGEKFGTQQLTAGQTIHVDKGSVVSKPPTEFVPGEPAVPKPAPPVEKPAVPVPKPTVPVEPAKPKRRFLTTAEVEAENKKLILEGSKGVNRIEEDFARQYTPKRVRDFLMDEIRDMLENPAWKKEAAAATGHPIGSADLAERVLEMFAEKAPSALAKNFIEKFQEGMPDLPELIDTAFRDRPRKDRALKFAVRKLKELFNRNEVDILNGLEPDNWRDFRVEVWEADPSLAMWIERNLKGRRNFAIEPIYTDATELVIPPPPPGGPKLRPGEKVGEIFQGEDQPFNLGGEKGRDYERLAREKAAAEQRAKEAAELEAKQQQTLFPSDTPPPEAPADIPPGGPEGPQGAIAAPGAPLAPAPSPVPMLTPKGQDQIIRDIAKALGTPIRFGRLRTSKFAGYFLPRPNLIGLKRAVDLPSATHEAGHRIDQMFGMSDDPTIRAELEVLGNPSLVPGSRSSWRPWRSQAYLRGEGVAEFLRHWLTDPARARALAPNTERLFEAVLNANKDLGDRLRTVRNDIQVWRNSPPEARLESHISIGSNPNKTPYTFDQMMRDLVNDLQFLEIASGEAAKAAPGGLAPSLDPNILARNLRGSYGMAEAFIKDGIVDFKTREVQMGTALEDALKPVAGRLREFRRWIVAKQAKQMRAQGKETGLVPSDVDFTVAKYQNDPAFNRASNNLQKVMNGVLNYMVDSGFITRDQAVSMRRMNDEFIPMHRVFEVGAGEPPVVEGGGTGRGLNVGKPSSLRHRGGSRRPIVDPLETIVRNIYTMVTAAEKAAINNAVANFATLPGMGKWVEHIAAPKQNIRVGIEKLREQLEDAGADLTDVPEDLLLNFFQNSGQAPFGENVIRVVRPDGSAQFYRLNRDLFDTFHALNYEDSGTILKLMAAPTQLLRAGVVLSPDFSIANALRDTFTAAVINRYGVLPFEVTARGLFALMGNPKLVAEWKASGGKSAVEAYYFDRAKLQQFLRERITKDLTLKEQAMIYAKSPLMALRWLTGTFEEATRIGEYQVAVRELTKRGMAIGDARRQAAFEARDRQDFSKGGAKTKSIRHLAAFWNAALQGNIALVKALQGNRKWRTILQGLAYITTAKLIEQAINWDDDDYWDRPQWERDLFFMFPAGKDETGHTRFARIPTPFEVGLIFGTLPGRLLQWYKQSYKKEALTTFPAEFLKQTIPNPLPQFLRPLFATFGDQGWDIWRGRTIVPDSMAELPPEMQWTEQTSLTARNVGKVLGVSPMKVDYMIRETTGGLGKQITHQIFDRAIELVSEQERTARGTVPGGRFVTTPAAVSSQSMEEFYSTLRDLRQEKARKKSGEPPRLPIEWLPIFEDVQKKMATLRKKTRQANLTEKERNQAQELKLQLAREIMRRYNARQTERP